VPQYVWCWTTAAGRSPKGQLRASGVVSNSPILSLHHLRSTIGASLPLPARPQALPRARRPRRRPKRQLRHPTMRHLQQTHRRDADADGARANLSQDRVEGCYSALSSLTVVLSASLQIVRVRSRGVTEFQHTRNSGRRHRRGSLTAVAASARAAERLGPCSAAVSDCLF
jgi:hypothetical protein